MALFADSHLLTTQPESECYVTDWFIGMLQSGLNIAHYLCSRRAARRKEQRKEFALNHRRSSNLGFQALHAQN